MKKSLFLLALVILTNTIIVKCQNIYDVYKIPYSIPYPITNIVSGPGFSGEYQLFIRNNDAFLNYNHWSALANADFGSNYNPLKPFSISYKIETVSFPFIPDFASSGLNQRILKVPSNSSYNYFTNEWNIGNPYGNHTKREFAGIYQPPVGGNISNALPINTSSTLVSAEFKDGFYSTFDHLVYPHSVLKHTIYIHCDAGANTKPIDSIQFVIDHTRGRMRSYPFYDINSTGQTDPPKYDILIVGNLLSSSFNSNSNELEPWNPYHGNSEESTINYFPYITNGIKDVCANKFFPNSDELLLPPSIISPRDYIHPAPYSLVGFELLNSLGDGPAGTTNINTNGIEHQYKIDKSIDLTIINPSEKVIYNPSEVSIDLNQTYNTTPASRILTFPSGYTFKTVHGVYPRKSTVEALDPYNLYHNKWEIPVPTTLETDDVGAVNDNIFSYYYVKSGSTLKIESCVAIYDTKIIVEDGATVIFVNRNSVTGNYICEKSSPTGTGIITDQGSTVSGTCGFECYTIENYDDFFGSTEINSSTGNQSWGGLSPFDYNGDGIVRIAGTLRIKSGYSLTINGGIHFEFGENGKVVVERGAKLIVNSHPSNPTTFKGAEFCKKNMWNGIEVWGETTNHNQIQNGMVSLTNTKISDARNAITTSRSEPITSPGDNLNKYYGGIIRCTNVGFNNNFRDVEFYPYIHKNTSGTGTEVHNLSFFTNCQFIITDKLKDPSYAIPGNRAYAGFERVKLNNVNRVRFDNCFFENSAVTQQGEPLFDVDLRGAGIYGLNSSIGLAGGNSKNTFKGFSDGIWMLNSDIDYISIQGTDFINNVHGLTLENTVHSGVTGNKFEIPVHETGGQQSTSGYNKPVGLYLISATKFTVTENTFTNYGTASTGNEQPEEYNYGIVVNNSFGSNLDGYGSAYKNNFQNLNINLQTELDNRGIVSASILQNTQIFPGTGFAYKCNDFNTRLNADVTVASKNGIAAKLREQGLCNDQFNPSNSAHVQAGNTYTAGCTSNEQLQFDYLAEDLDLNEGRIFKYRDQPLKLICSTIPSATQNCLSSIGNNPCISTSCLDFPCAITAYGTASSQLAQLINNFGQLLDGGNTQNLLNSINGTLSLGQLKNLLMSKSPYLSDTVLIAMLKRANSLPPGHIQQIIIANSPLTKKVLTAVDETNVPVGIKNNILSAQIGISARKEKESEIDYYAFEKNMKELNLTQLYLEVDNLDSLKKIAQKDTSLLGLFKLMEVLLAQGDLSGAQTCRADIISKETPHISDRCKFLSMQLNLALQGKTWFDIDSTQTAKLTEIYLNNPETAIYARNVLAMVKGLRYEKYPFDIVQVRRGITSSEQLNHIIEISNRLKVYPNPANDFSTVEIKLDDTITNVELIIYNLLGSKVYSQQVKNNDIITIDNKEVNNGIYLYVLKANNEIIEKQKVIISK